MGADCNSPCCCTFRFQAPGHGPYRTRNFNMMSSNKLRSIVWIAPLLIATVGNFTELSAQTNQIPFLSTYAGVPAGGSAVACSNDIPTYKGAHVGDGCPANQATLNAPSSTAIDAYGNIYISDFNNRLVRVIYQGGTALTAMLIAASPAVSGFVPAPGHIYTLAGSLQAILVQSGSPSKAYYCNGAGTGVVGLGSNGDGCPATQGYVQPRGLAIDANGNVFIANLAGGEGMRVVYAGGSQVASLITTLNPTVISPQVGYVYSIAGNSTAGYKGDGSNARTASFENVRDVTVDHSGNLFITDGNSAGSTTNNNIREINGTTGIINTISGSTAGPASACPSTGSFGGDGGPASVATLNSPYAMFMDSFGNLYFADSCNGRLRVIYAGGTIPGQSNPVVGNIYTVAGGGSLTGGATGVPATQLSIALMQSAGIDPAGNLYVVDNTNRYVWQINQATGIATLYGGLGLSGKTAVPAPAAGTYCNGTNGPQSIDSSGDGCPALQSSISPSLRYIGDSSGNVYAIESSAGILRRYSPNSIFSPTAVGATVSQSLAFTVSAPDSFTLQGTATTEYSDAGGTICSAIASSPSTNLCVYNISFSPSQAGTRPGSISFGSNGNLGTFLLSGLGTAAQLSIDPATQSTLGSGLTPQGIASDLAGNLFVADAKVGQVVRISASDSSSSSVVAGLSNPNQVAIDGAGNLYVADTGNSRIVERTAVSGSNVVIGTGFNAPQGVAVDGSGNLYVADTGNNRVVEISGGAEQTTLPIAGLNQPTRIALDSENDVFVADQGNSRIVVLSPSQGQTTVSFGSMTVKPMGVATDPAGDIYVADANSLQVVELLANGSTVNVLATGLKSPSDLSVGPNASVYIADTASPGAIVVNRALGAIVFPVTNFVGGQSTNANLILSDTGNANLTFPAAPIASPTAPSTIFTVQDSAVNSCVAGTPVAAGAECLLTGSFTPSSGGAQSQLFALATNAANNTVVGARLSGTGLSLTATSTTVSVTSPSASAIGFGTPVSLKAVVTLSSNVGTPSGTITLSIDGKAQTPAPFGDGTIPITLNPTVGTHVVTAVFSGDSIYASSSSSVSFTVSQAMTTTGLNISVGSSGGSPFVTLTASISSPTAAGETGTVNFYSGTTLLSTLPLSGSAVSYSTENLSFANNSFTAVYSGDVNFTSSSSAVVQPSPDFVVTASVSTLATAQGGVATTAVTLTPVFGFSGTVTPSCGTLPSNAVCRFQPTAITFSGNAPIGVSIQVYTNVSVTSRVSQEDKHLGVELALLGPSGLGLFVLALWRKRQKIGILGLLAILIASFWSIGSLTGCVQHPVQLETAPGTQNLTVTFTGSGGNTPPAHSITFSLAINTP
jgi:streptogramin lyase